MSIIERTTNLLLTQFKGSSINPAYLEYYTSDMKKIDDAYASVDGRLSTLETASRDYADRLTSLETWKTEVVTPTLTEYDNRLDAIEAVIATVSTANIDALTERVNALEHKVEANSAQIITLNGNVEALSSAVTNIQRVDEEQGGRLTVLESKVSTLEECCTEVRTTLTAYDARITTNANNISALDTRLTADEALISANAQDITILANQVQTNANNINRILNDIPIDDIINAVSRITALETLCGDDTLTTTAQTLTGAVNELVSSISSTDSDLTTLASRVTTNETDISNLKTKVGTAVLTTTAPDLSGAVNELDSGLSALSGLPTDVSNLTTRVGTAEGNITGIDNRVTVLEGAITSGSTSLTARGLTFSFMKKNGWCICDISGTTDTAIADGDTWSEVVPAGYIPSVTIASAGVVPIDINNSLLSIKFTNTTGVISSNCVATISIGTTIKHRIAYPL